LGCRNLADIKIGMGNLNYTDLNGVLFNEGKTLLIAYPEGKVKIDYAIPDGVTSIGDSAFAYCTRLTSITIPDGVTTIEDTAFFSCSSLTSITIPDGVTTIGDGAFDGCSSLTSITIPDSVTSIRVLTNKPFSYCAGLTDIQVGEGNLNYTDVNGILFNKEKTVLIAHPEGKAKIDYAIPDGVTIIGQGAFGICSNLASVMIPDSVVRIWENAFDNCTGLTDIQVGEGNLNYTDVNGILFNKEKTVLIAHPAGKTEINYTVPDRVTSISMSAFSGCRNLTSITIGDGVTSIGGNAFLGSANLSFVTFLGDAPKTRRQVFKSATPTIYRKPEAKGWGDTWGGRPVKLISEKP